MAVRYFRFAIQALVILAAVFWIYWRSRHGGWISDDLPNILQNPLLRDPDGLEKIWFEPTHHIEFYPIEETVQWIQWQLWSDDTLGYHLTNMVMHALNALLLWAFFWKLGLRWAWLGGLLFAIHPVQVESVAWMSELKNLLSLGPFLLAMIFWIDYENRGRIRDYFAALGFFVFAMLCKISMAPFPFVMLLYAWWKRGRVGARDLLRSAPFFVISLTLGVVTILLGDSFHARFMPVTDPVPVDGIASRIACAGLSFSFYLKQCLWPFGLLPVYPPWQINPPSPFQFLPWPIFAGLFFWLWIKRRTWGRHLLLGVGFFLLMIAPFLGLNTISYMSFTWVMDHFLYLPSIGVIGLLVVGLERLEERLAPNLRVGFIAAIWVAMLGLAFSARGYASIYRSQEALSSYELKYNPGAWTEHTNLGNALSDQNRLPEAMAHYRQALLLKPDYVTARYNLGNALLNTGHYPEAVAQYREVITEHPMYPKAHNNLAVALAQMGHLPDAIAEIQAELANYPDDDAARENLRKLEGLQKISKQIPRP